MKTSTLLANILLTIGPAAVIAGVAFYSWPAAMVLAGVLLGAVGVLLAVATPAKVEPEEDRQWPPQRPGRFDTTLAERQLPEMGFDSPAAPEQPTARVIYPD